MPTQKQSKWDADHTMREGKVVSDTPTMEGGVIRRWWPMGESAKHPNPTEEFRGRRVVVLHAKVHMGGEMTFPYKQGEILTIGEEIWIPPHHGTGFYCGTSGKIIWATDYGRLGFICKGREEVEG